MAKVYKIRSRKGKDNLDMMVMKIVSAMQDVGFPIEDYSIEDILLNDMNNINAIYTRTREEYGITNKMEKSYEFLYSLFRKYGGITLFDVLEKIYGDEAKAYNTNLQVKLMEEIKYYEEEAKALVFEQGIRDLIGAENEWRNNWSQKPVWPS